MTQSNQCIYGFVKTTSREMVWTFWTGRDNQTSTTFVVLPALNSWMLSSTTSEERLGEQIVAKSETQLFDFDEPEREESEPYVDAVTLVSAINEEPEYNRELLKMVYFGKKIKQKKLAELLDIPYITLKQDVKKARESIKDKFEKKKGDSESKE